MKRQGRLFHPTDLRIYEHRKWLAIEAALEGDPVRFACVAMAHHYLCLNAHQNHFPDGVYGSEIEMLRTIRGLQLWTIDVMRHHSVIDGLALHGFREWCEDARRAALAEDRNGRRLGVSGHSSGHSSGRIDGDVRAHPSSSPSSGSARPKSSVTVSLFRR